MHKKNSLGKFIKKRGFVPPSYEIDQVNLVGPF